jgi:plastocyanin domain-containing protein
MQYFKTIGAHKLGKIVIGSILLGLVKVVTIFAAAESVVVPLSADNVQRLEITVDSYSFTPDRFVVKENIPVEVIFKSVSWIVPHNFVLKSPEAGLTIEEDIGPGETTTVRFTPTALVSLSLAVPRSSFSFEVMRIWEWWGHLWSSSSNWRSCLFTW